jgi:hypothetical protein
MKLTCPNCYETLSLAALIEHDAAREAIKLALEFPAPLGKLLLQYASLFKPAQRALSMDRFASILSEILPMIQAAQIERNGRAWPAPQAYWNQAFETMMQSRDKLTLPLKSHGYLLEIISGFANKAEGKQERQTEQGRKYGEVKTFEQTTSVSKTIEKPVKAKSEKTVIPTHISEQIRNRDWQKKGGK